MYVLDTNVVSEWTRTRPEACVMRWLDAHPVEHLHLTSVSLAELRYGLAVLPDGRRKRVLSQQIESAVIPLFRGRVLGFGEAASHHYAEIQARARRAGRPMPLADALIASIARERGLAVATRDVRGFEASGVEVVNPWDPARTQAPGKR